MTVTESIEETRNWLGSAPKPIVFVPTMGALHEGHLSLLRIGRDWGGPQSTVVASIFVNPAQFAPHEDFDSYPRELEADVKKCEEEGTALVFAPARELMYADDASVRLVEDSLSTGLCGSSRPHFFGGVCTVVAKLFHIIQPDAAVFGEKDFQQLAIIRRMVRDLHFPIEILGGPIVREPDGLAMSSRNQYLNPEERKQAVVLNQSLSAAADLIHKGESNAAIVESAVRKQIQIAPGAAIDYVEIVNPESLQPMEEITGNTLIAIAVVFGSTRLIDNRLVRV